MFTALDPTVLLLIVIAPFIGSFLSVLVVRLPQDEGVVFGRSACRSCARTLAPRDLVPVLSWLLLGGRCRQCHAAIGLLYPAMELGALAIAIWSVAVMPGWLAAATAGLGWVLLALAVIDWRDMLLPDVLTLPLAVAGLLVSLALPFSDPLVHVRHSGHSTECFRVASKVGPVGTELA